MKSLAVSASLKAFAALLVLLFLPPLTGCGVTGNIGAAIVDKTGAHLVGIKGSVTASSNPQVAIYTVTSPYSGNLKVVFGKTTSYGLSTSTVPIVANQPTTVEVAGMVGGTTYHMQAQVQTASGSLVEDVDETFLPSTPAQASVIFTAATAPGMEPQSGVELMNIISPVSTGAIAMDLSGNPIWTYFLQGAPSGSLLYPIKLLSNGHFIFMVGSLPQGTSNGAPPSVSYSVVQEVDLAGTTIHQLTVQDLNTRMAAAGFNFSLLDFSHDLVSLPNGHLLVLGSVVKTFTNLPGYPGTTNVLGDAVVDLDKNWQPVWTWNAFDHLDINRHPYLFPDWTHGNALLYTDDGNILLSLRHQNWILKLDYANGQGRGDILWRLGEGGDFKLKGGVDPTDWFYAQHGPSFFSSNSSGVFSLGVFDNGDDRIFPSGAMCGTSGAPPCYSTVPVLQVDEGAKTATLLFHDVLPQKDYSYFGGNVELLDDGDLKYTLCTLKGMPTDAVYEITYPNNPQPVWNIQGSTVNTYIYRSNRLGSLYPGVQW
jgi:arylsulfate sulfotransferase